MDQADAIPAARTRRDWRFKADVAWWTGIGIGVGGQLLMSFLGIRSRSGAAGCMLLGGALATLIARLVRPDRDQSIGAVFFQVALSGLVAWLGFVEGPLRLTGFVPEPVAFGVPPLIALVAFLRIARHHGKPAMTWRAAVLISVAAGIAWAIWGPSMLR